MNEENEFKDMPPLSDEAREYMRHNFQPYLIFKTVNPTKKTKEYTCTACGKTFKSGSTVKERTITPEMRALWSAKHKEAYKCPYCGTQATAINSKILNTENLNEYKYVCIFIKNNRDDVWIRCFERWKKYSGTKYNCDFRELMRYRLRPGQAEFWELCGDDWLKGNFREAFTWNHGCWCEKYCYEFYGDDFALDENDWYGITLDGVCDSQDRLWQARIDSLIKARERQI